jgi:hypothetical protein
MKLRVRKSGAFLHIFFRVFTTYKCLSLCEGLGHPRPPDFRTCHLRYTRALPASLALFRARGGCRALADKDLHLKLRVLGPLIANADLLFFHGCKVLHHLSKREKERERGRLDHGRKIHNK